MKALIRLPSNVNPTITYGVNTAPRMMRRKGMMQEMNNDRITSPMVAPVKEARTLVQ